ncbi:MAG: aspartate kinase [Chitinophagales bacterium]|nr:aspartate kinase [Chitinophagales bacterium]
MLVFKFGGASVKDADSIKNVASILSKYEDQKKLVVVSAMGKTTNALEDVVNLYIAKDQKYQDYLHEIREYHQYVCDELFGANHGVQHKVFALFDAIENFCASNISDNYTFIYDQIISVGELASSKLISEYLKHIGKDNQWLDAREMIRTDHAYTDAKILWEETEKLCLARMSNVSQMTSITQGFIGSTSERFTTTLGREGSDFSAAIFSFCLNAEKMVIWKDVEGVMNADPKQFSDAVLIKQIAFKEAIEMTYYGAKVIHPKTIRPLQNKNIPLEVRSFIASDKGGTLIHSFDEEMSYPPIIVVKEDQVLLRFSAKDFSFIAENHMEEIFGAFADLRLRMNIMQNGAISFSAAVDNKKEKIQEIVKLLEKDFSITQTESLNLLTIRHYNDNILQRELANREVWLTQKTRETIQLLCKV